MATNFIDDPTAEPFATKTGNPRPVSNATTQWGMEDANGVKNVVDDIRSWAQRGVANALAFGAVGDGVTNDAAALQRAINASYGRPLVLPYGQQFNLGTTPLIITSRCSIIVGGFGERNNIRGTQILYSGVGAAIQYGTDNGHSWDAGDYDGPQDHIIENLWISHSSPDTALISAPGKSYKAGAYGIWDWRCGGIRMRNVGIEGFEANFVGVQSDINTFDTISSFYSKYGFYFGPRSDQNTVRDLYAFFCDRAVTIDRAGQTRLITPQLVFCGHSTASPVEIRQGSHGTVLIAPWLENSGSGYQGTDGLSMISAGEVAGYGPGGSIQSPGGTPTTTACQGLDVLDPHCYNIIAGGASHKRYLLSVNKCTQARISHPTEYINSSLNNFDALVGVQAANSPSSADCQVHVSDPPLTMTLSKIFQNLGGGSPVFTVNAENTINSATLGYDTTASHVIRGSVAYAAPAGTNGWVLSNSNTAQTGGGNAVVQARQNGSYDATSGAQFPVALLAQGLATRSAGSNTVRNTAGQFQASGAQQNWAIETTDGDVRLNTSSGMTVFGGAIMGVITSIPTTGTHVQGEIYLNAAPSAGGFIGWACTTGGTPGTWKTFGAISP